MTTIGACGFGNTGSGAMLDFLKEFEDCSFPAYEGDFEFMLPYIQHGLQDLEYQIMTRPTRFFSSDAAIKDYKRLVKMYDCPRGPYRKLGGNIRKLTDEFIDEIVQIHWGGYTYEDRFFANEVYRTLRYRIYERIALRLEAIMPYRLNTLPYEKTYLSVQPEEFVEKARKYVRKILNILRFDFSKNIVLNQPFDVSDPEQSMKYFENPKAIIVDRDPRDIYVLAKKYLKSMTNFIPVDTVEDYILYHKLIRKPIRATESQDVMRIHYEEMIYDYDRFSERMIAFFGLNPNTWDKKKYFDPAISIENTQLFLRHPELADDIKKIERELSEYLYPFEQYEARPTNLQRPF